MDQGQISTVSRFGAAFDGYYTAFPAEDGKGTTPCLGDWLDTDIYAEALEGAVRRGRPLRVPDLPEELRLRYEFRTNPPPGTDF
jgi:hypothetical protein